VSFLSCVYCFLCVLKSKIGRKMDFLVQKTKGEFLPASVVGNWASELHVICLII
jgi:hypothetical protein